MIMRLAAMLLLSCLAAPALAQAPAAGTSAPVAATFSDIADLAVAAPVVVDATITDAVALEPARAPNVAPGHRRMFVRAKVNGLIRGAGGVPGAIRYLVDVPVDNRGRPPKLAKQRVLLFGKGVSDGDLQLAAPGAQLGWTPAVEATARALAAELVKPGAPPAITGVSGAFHVAGALPGDGETQIFLKTATGAPVSLSVLRRAGGERQWAAAFGEIVDEAAGRPQRDTLGWYRLACGLPPNLPASALAALSPAEAGAARDDYQLVLRDLGPCTRSRAAR